MLRRIPSGAHRVRPGRRRHQGLLRGRRAPVPGRASRGSPPTSSPPPRPAPSPPPSWPRPARSPSSRTGSTRSRATSWPGPRPSTSSASRPGSARSTARRSGREIHQEITEGTRPPFPLTPSTVLAGDEVVPACDCRPQGTAPGPPGPAQAPAPPGPAGGRGRAPAAAGPAPAAQQRQLGPQPRPAGRRAPPRQRGRRPGRSIPRSIARPGLQLRLAVTALRAGVLRYVTEDGTIVESDARTPAPAESRRARSTSSTAPSPRPACRWSSRRTRWPTTTTSTAG